MAINSFRPRTFEDHEILDGNHKVVGHVRVKPSGILWAPANSKVWYRVDLACFREFMEAQGNRQKK